MGAATLGAVSGALGVYAVLRGQSLIGDAMSHAALPGIALAYLATQSKLPLVLMAGAGATGWLATLAVMAVVRRSRIKYDGALALVLSVFFGIGLVLLTYIQRTPDAGQAGLDTFLFGQAATLVTADVLTMAGLGAVAIAGVMLFWKEFKLLSFDESFGQSLGLPMRAIDIGLTTLTVTAIVIGLQAVGVVLMSAMLVAPAAAARQWTDRLGVMMALSTTFGVVAGVSGAVLSSRIANLPTGPTIVLCATALVAASMLFAPHRGLLFRHLRRKTA
jgi:manganese/zinc/iron transport system permease protein